MALSSAACGGNDDVCSARGPVEAVVTDAPDDLGETTNDTLFLFEVTASDGAYALEDLTLFAELGGGGGLGGTSMVLTDADEDGLVGPGDSILTSEENDSWYTAEDSGDTLEVVLRYRWATSMNRELFRGCWNAE